MGLAVAEYPPAGKGSARRGSGKKRKPKTPRPSQYPPSGSGSARREPPKPLDPDVIEELKKKWAERPGLPPTPPSYGYDPNKVKPDAPVFYRPSKRVRERRLRKRKQFKEGKEAYEAMQKVLKGTPGENALPDQDWSDKAMRRAMKGRRGLTKDGADYRKDRLRKQWEDANRKFAEGRGEFPGPYMYTDAHPDEVKWPTVDGRRIHKEELPEQLREEFKHLILPYDVEAKRTWQGKGEPPPGIGTLVIPDIERASWKTEEGGSKRAYRVWDPVEREYVWKKGPMPEEQPPTPEDWAKRPGSFPDVTGRPGWKEAIDPSTPGAQPGAQPGAENQPSAAGQQLELGVRSLREALFLSAGHDKKGSPEEAKASLLKAQSQLTQALKEAEAAGDTALQKVIEKYLQTAITALHNLSKKEAEPASTPPIAADEDRWGKDATGELAWGYEELEEPKGGEVSRLRKIESNQILQEGDLLQEKGKYENAIAAYTDAIRLNPNNEEAYRGRAVAKMHGGDLAGSNEDMDKAMRMEEERAAKEPMLPGYRPPPPNPPGYRPPQPPFEEVEKDHEPDLAALRGELEREPEVDPSQIPDTGLPDQPIAPGQYNRWNSEEGRYEATPGEARPEWKRLRDLSDDLSRQAYSDLVFDEDKKELRKKAEKALSEAIFQSRKEASAWDRADMLEQRAFLKQRRGDMEGAARDNRGAEFLKKQAQEEEDLKRQQSSSDPSTPEGAANWANAFVERITGGMA